MPQGGSYHEFRANLDQCYTTDAEHAWPVKYEKSLNLSL